MAVEFPSILACSVRGRVVDEPADGLWSVGSSGPIPGKSSTPSGRRRRGPAAAVPARAGPACQVVRAEPEAAPPAGTAGSGGSPPAAAVHRRRRTPARHRRQPAGTRAATPHRPPTPAPRPPMPGATPWPRPRPTRGRPTRAARISITPRPHRTRRRRPPDMMPVAPPDMGPNAMLPPAARTDAGPGAPLAPCSGGCPGLRGEYFDNDDFTGSKFVRQDARIDFVWEDTPPDSSMDTRHVLGPLGGEDPPALQRELHLLGRGQRQRPPVDRRPPVAERVRQQRPPHHRRHHRPQRRSGGGHRHRVPGAHR